jgi:hypothetical protein
MAMTGRAGVWAAHADHLGRSRRLRLTAIVIVVAFAILTLTGFFGVPLLLGHIIRGSVAARIHRRVTIGTIRFNPYTLRLSADALHVSERGGAGDFAAVGQIRLKASWSSLYRLAPIIQELTIDAPVLNVVHIVRPRSHTVNFADLLDIPLPHLRFAVSNIRLNGGQVHFYDRTINEHHRVEQIQIGVPFIANLPADTRIFVQPLLRMVIDGSPFRLVGVALPFASTPEYVLDITIKALNLTRVAAYLANTLPIKIQRGSLSSSLQLRFMQLTSGPVIRISGTINVDGLDVHDASNAPLVSFKTASVALTDVDPLHQLAILGDIGVGGLSADLVRNPGGTTNLTPLTAALAPSTDAAGAKNAGSNNGEGPPFYVFVHSFDLANSELNLRDNTTATPVALALKGVHVGFKNFATNKQAPAVPFQVQAHLGDGSLGLTGNLDLAHRRAAVKVALDKIDLPPLQAFAQPFWAGILISGKLSAKAQVQTDFAPDKFNVLVQPVALSVDTLELHAPGDTQKPVQLKNLDVALDKLDLNARRAAIKEVHLDGLGLSVRRSRNGAVSLETFLRAAQPQSPAAASAATKSIIIVPGAASKPALAVAPGWQYQIASVTVENVETEVEDDSAAQPIILKVAPLNLHLKDVSSDLSKPIALNIDAALMPYGGFKIDGTVVVNPPAAKLHVVTTTVDLSPADVYLGSYLNAKLTRATLTMDGNLEVGRGRDNFILHYDGDATLGNLRMTDKVTNEKFLRWAALRASRIDANIGNGAPRVAVGNVVLADFYARVILNSNGKLNLSDLVAAPREAPKSITQANPSSDLQEVPAAKPQQPPSAAPAKPPTEADIMLGEITLQGGAINYTDNFIRPHYTVALTNIGGKIDGFGTRSTKPAEVEIEGLINSVSPTDITGSINPLAPKAFIDINAKSDGYQLINFTPYSTKYTGYPIAMGTLKADINYLVQNSQLTATNHLLISRLTFGDKVPSPSAINLPLALAVALLKNQRGDIDVTIPVSGSLNDPQFSLGALYLQALKDLILKIVEAPFSLLASVAGDAGGSHQNLQYVAFPPGLATLTPAATSQLSIVAKAMQRRPGLRLTMSGRVEPSVDRPGLRAAMVDRLVKMQKVNEISAHGESADATTVELTPDEYDKYLTVVYTQAKFDKPRNFLGLDKSLPPAEMKELLVENIKVTDDDLKKLAIARVVAVGHYLDQQVDPVRLAVVVPNISAPGTKDKGQVTGVDLAIN